MIYRNSEVLGRCVPTQNSKDVEDIVPIIGQGKRMDDRVMMNRK
jgi:hypothetical protein